MEQTAVLHQNDKLHFTGIPDARMLCYGWLKGTKSTQGHDLVPVYQLKRSKMMNSKDDIIIISHVSLKLSVAH